MQYINYILRFMNLKTFSTRMKASGKATCHGSVSGKQEFLILFKICLLSLLAFQAYPNHHFSHGSSSEVKKGKHRAHLLCFLNKVLLQLMILSNQYSHSGDHISYWRIMYFQGSGEGILIALQCSCQTSTPIQVSTLLMGASCYLGRAT